MNVHLLGFDDEAKQYEGYLKKLGCAVVQGEAGVVLLRRAQVLDDVQPHVQALRHVFVLQHSLPAADLRVLRKLADEAGVQLHFSAPLLYCRNIPDVVALLREVKFVQVYRDYEAAAPLQVGNLESEILTAACAVRARVGRVERVRSIVPCDFEVLGLRIDFHGTATAYFWLGSAAFVERHELRLFGSGGMAVVDVLKREARVKTLDGSLTSIPFLSEKEGRKKELADFVGNLRRGAPAFVSVAEVEALRTVEEKKIA